MASPGVSNSAGDVHLVDIAADSSTKAGDEIVPLLVVDAATNNNNNNSSNSNASRPRMNIFSVSSAARKPPKEPIYSAAEVEFNFISQFFSWTWSGSRHSGLLCMAFSSIIYFLMDVLLDLFPVRAIPVYQTMFTRCTILLVISFIWLRKNGQPFSFPTHLRNVLLLRSLTGFVSLLSFVYSIQNLPLSYAVLLNFAMPVMASVGAKFILQEKLVLSQLGGLLFSFIGIVLIFPPMLLTGGGDTKTVQSSDTVSVAHDVLFVFVGLVSSVLGGVSYCLIQAGSKGTDPGYTVFSFAILACPLSAICLFAFEELVLPSLFTFLLMIMLGVLAFFAEIFLARGVQLEKITKVTNIIYTKVLLSQLWSMAFTTSVPSFSAVIGCLVIFLSICSTLYFGTEKENE